MSDSKFELLLTRYDELLHEPRNLRGEMIRAVNELIQHDFHRLVALLYRIDVSEKKLRAELAARPNEDAAGLITDLVIARLEEKRCSRQQFRQKGEIPEDEKW